MADDDKPKKDEQQQSPPDVLASAAAVGMAMAGQALEMWFGVVSGMARAGQDILKRNEKDAEESRAYEPDAKATETAKAAARTMMAEFERATKNVVEVASHVTAQVVEDQTKAASVAKAEKKTEVPKAPVKAEAVVEQPKQEVAPKVEKPVVSLVKTAEVAVEAVKPVIETPAVVAPVEVLPVVEPVKQTKPVAKAKPAAAKAKPVAAVNAEKPQAPVVLASPKAENLVAPKWVAKPEMPDDLKLLPGVGPKLERVLNGIGVWTYGQVASWTPAEVAYVEDMTGLNGIVAADGWLEQAKTLSQGATKH